MAEPDKQHQIFKLKIIMKKYLEIFVILLAGMIAGAYVQTCQTPKEGRSLSDRPAVEVDTSTYQVKIPYHLPSVKQEVSLGTRITFLPVFIPKESRDSISPCDKPADALTTLNDEVGISPPDSVAVEIPITQREYEGEEYHAWVSGFDPRLDSIFVFHRREVVTVREPPNRSKRWGIGVFAGYGMTPQGLQPCAGISINYNLWNF